jgi:hypothetical protein
MPTLENPPVKPFSNKCRIALGSLAILFYIFHGWYWVTKGVPANVLWACHLGSFLIGLGLLSRISVFLSIGVSWLVLGNGMWILYLTGGGEFVFTSLLTHLGGIVIGVFALFRYGFPQWTWLWATISLFAVQQISRWITPAEENINLAFRVHNGWESIFPSYSLYLLFLLLFIILLFYIVEIFFRRITPR